MKVVIFIKHSFDEYKHVSNEVLKVLIKNNCSALNDIKIIYNILMGFPHCINSEGNFVYCGEFYNSMEDLPADALEQIIRAGGLI